MTEAETRALFELEATRLGYSLKQGSNSYSNIKTETLWLGFQLGILAKEQGCRSVESLTKRL